MITFYAENQINNFKNVTNRINVVSALELCMYYYCKMKIESKIDENGLKIYDSNAANKMIPFRVYCFKNITEYSLKVKLDIREKDLKKCCIYNDSIASEFDNYTIKEINPKNVTTILIMDYNLKNQYEEPQ
jgi:hypothetical protein